MVYEVRMEITTHIAYIGFLVNIVEELNDLDLVVENCYFEKQGG